MKLVSLNTAKLARSKESRFILLAITFYIWSKVREVSEYLVKLLDLVCDKRGV